MNPKRDKRHGKCNTRIYKIWTGMKSRCNNKNAGNYCRYGGKNIKICKDWENDFMKFYEWSIKNGYKPRLSIDRIDGKGNYEPTNCRWTTTNTQARNTAKATSNTSGYIGVSFCKKSKKWRSELRVNYKLIFLGFFNSKSCAATVRDNFIIENDLEHTLNLK